MILSKDLIRRIIKILGLSGFVSNLRSKFIKTNIILNPNSPHLIKKDEDIDKKADELLDGIKDFGKVDFANLCPWIFTSSVQNHHIIHERIDEASLLWMMTKKSKGNILELGRAAGGSTIVILGSSQYRNVTSIDRDPRSLTIAKKVFKREDIKNRLKLYNQSSRKDVINENYGFMFVDGDHSYDGICHDIAKFWNNLQKIDDQDAIAVFHDAQENPHAFVPSVKKALDELMEEKAAEKITSWGAQLAVRKLKNIDREKWHEKIDKVFWEKYNSFFDEENLNPQKKTYSLENKAKVNFFNNILGYNNMEENEWSKENISVEKIEVTADNPIRFLKKIKNNSDAKIYRKLDKVGKSFTMEIFLRPKLLNNFQIFFEKDSSKLLAEIDIFLESGDIKINQKITDKIFKISDIKINYLNAFYHCYFCFENSTELENINLGISINNKLKSNEGGIFINCISLDIL